MAKTATVHTTRSAWYTYLRCLPTYEPSTPKCQERPQRHTLLPTEPTSQPTKKLKRPQDMAP
ncbi:uncharacterized protein BX663DRAFT_549357 [Cokeromyces recurvatus]|uniref:uncharacterized protein n=1 Tax=Cokeromyces recurvatus TaxID=90255 RepID=UPI00221FCB6F|nr:uncharacterized protein BX663DRAFT_549357 [Cokeromyces recurvatus]KAI7906262.1 hypothetical protein BX663DRAFT_549357 [Cokeromyces recurvatus]